MPPTDPITPSEFHAADGAEAWRVLGDGACSFFATRSYPASARFVAAIGELEGIDAHPVDLDVRPDGVTVRLLTYTDDYYGMTGRDLERARQISAIARKQGLEGDPHACQSIGPIVIGAVDIAKVMPFWEALTGYVRRADSPAEDLVDPRGRGPGIWFEEVTEPGGGRPRMHFACWVPIEQAEARVQAAVAAGGRVVYGDRAPSWWLLADPEGNEADVATTQGRD